MRVGSNSGSEGCSNSSCRANRILSRWIATQGEKKHAVDNGCNDGAISSRRNHDRIDDSSLEDNDNVGSNSSLGGIGEEASSNNIGEWLRIRVVEGGAKDWTGRMVTKKEGVIGNGGVVCHGEGTCS